MKIKDHSFGSGFIWHRKTACCPDHFLSIIPTLHHNLLLRRKVDNFVATMDDTKLEAELEPEHLKAIEALAEEIDCPKVEVNKIYASALGNIKSSARIKDYLIVLTSKKVRDVLHH